MTLSSEEQLANIFSMIDNNFRPIEKIDIHCLCHFLEEALHTAFMNQRSAEEEKMKITVEGVFQEGEIVFFECGLKGRVIYSSADDEGEPYTTIEAFCADFRPIWKAYLAKSAEEIKERCLKQIDKIIKKEAEKR